MICGFLDFTIERKPYQVLIIWLTDCNFERVYPYFCGVTVKISPRERSTTETAILGTANTEKRINMTSTK